MWCYEVETENLVACEPAILIFDNPGAADNAVRKLSGLEIREVSGLTARNEMCQAIEFELDADFLYSSYRLDDLYRIYQAVVYPKYQQYAELVNAL